MAYVIPGAEIEEQKVLVIEKRDVDLYGGDIEELGVQNAMRKDLSMKFLELFEVSRVEAKKGSVPHIEASIKILNALADLNGLKKPTIKKTDKTVTEVKLDWSANMKGGG